MRTCAERAPLLVVMMVALSGASAAGQEPTTAPPRASTQDARWSVEAVGGWARIAPADLNARSLNAEVAYSSYYEALFQAYGSAFGSSFSSSITKDGEFPRIARGWTGGFRVSRRLGARFAAALGVQYLSQSRSASVSRGHQSTLFNANASSFETTDAVSYRFAPSLLAVRSVATSIGLRGTFLRRGPFTVDALAQAGPAWGSSRIEEDATTTSSYYNNRSTSSTRIRGRGWTPYAEAGARMHWALWKRWGLVAEATYQRQRFKKVSGTQASGATIQNGDATSVERERSTSVSGTWRLLPYQISTSFYKASQPSPGIGGDQYPAFALDLSGARVQLGVAVRLW